MTMPDYQANKAIVRKFFEYLTAADVDGILSLYADGFTCWTAGSLPFSGLHPREEVPALVGGVAQVFPGGWQFTVKTMTAEDDRVAVEAECHGKHISGQTYDQCYHFLFFVRDGKIQSFKEYFDTKHAYEVLCSIPAPGFNQ